MSRNLGGNSGILITFVGSIVTWIFNLESGRYGAE